MSTMNPAMPTASPTPRLSRLDRLLPAWIFVAMAIGVALGKLFPNIDDDLNRVKVAGVSVPIAIGLLQMRYPVLAWAFLSDEPHYRNGLSWNMLARGDGEVVAVLVAPVYLSRWLKDQLFAHSMVPGYQGQGAGQDTRMAEQILKYGVTAHVTGRGVSRGIITGKTVEVEFDTSAGQSDALPGPADLLVMAFAACVLKNVERMSSFMPFAYEGATIEVTAERETKPPRMARIHYVLTVTTDEPERRVALLSHNIAKQGTIYNTLAQVCEISGDVVAVEPPLVVSTGGAGQAKGRGTMAHFR